MEAALFFSSSVNDVKQIITATRNEANISIVRQEGLKHDLRKCIPIAQQEFKGRLALQLSSMFAIRTQKLQG